MPLILEMFLCQESPNRDMINTFDSIIWDDEKCEKYVRGIETK